MQIWMSRRSVVERRLKQTSARLRALRHELPVIDEQLAHLSEEADEMSVRSVVSDEPGVAVELRRAREHVAAMRKHRDHVVATIGDLEARQDTLLDQMNA